MFSKEVKENLSKYKYIYKIYRVDNDFHIEHYPIVYMNDTYVYVKENSKKLKEIVVNYRYNKIFTDIEEAIKQVQKYNNCENIYYIDKYEVDINIEELKLQWSKEKKQKDIKDKENNLARAKREYERALKELEDIKNKN